jgi:hypothetical protein
MAAENTPTTMEGIFKDVYGKDVLDKLIPTGFWFYNKMKERFKKEAKLGNKFKQPAVLGLEHGVTYNGSAGSIVTLNDPISATTKEAEIQGVEIILRAQMGILTAQRAISDKGSFISGTKYMVQNMMKSLSKRLEVSMLYGQTSLAVVSSVAGSVITITDDSWAPGFWSGMEEAAIDVFQSDDSTLRQATAISTVDLDNKTITVDTIGSIAATDLIYYKSQMANGGTKADMVGLYKIGTQITGDLFGISTSAYSLWRGNIISTAQDISFAAIEKAVAKAMAKGLEEDVIAFVNPPHWAELLDELTAKRQFDSSYSTAVVEEGAKNIKFHGINGMIEIVASNYVKGCEAFIFPLSCLAPVGSTDITFDSPIKQDCMFQKVPNKNAFEFSCYSDQALFCDAPSKLIVFTGLNIPS